MGRSEAPAAPIGTVAEPNGAPAEPNGAPAPPNGASGAKPNGALVERWRSQLERRRHTEYTKYTIHVP